MSEALQALYEGDVAGARGLLPPDSDLTIFEAAAFGRVDRLREILAAEPSQVSALSVEGVTAVVLSLAH